MVNGGAASSATPITWLSMPGQSTTSCLLHADLAEKLGRKMVVVLPSANFIKDELIGLAGSQAGFGVKFGIGGMGRIRGRGRPHRHGRFILKDDLGAQRHCQAGRSITSIAINYLVSLLPALAALILV